MGALDRLAELGLQLPPAPQPVASYVTAVRTGDLVFTSGQLPLVDGALPATGLVGEREGDVSPATAQDLARTAALNGLAVVDAALRGSGGLDAVVRVVKVTGFVASAPGFTGQPGVVNGASDLLVEVLGEAGRHARSAVGVAELPLGAPVEVELVVEVA